LQMFHIVETFGFQCPGQSSCFTYFTDSSWKEKLLDCITDEKCTVLLDLNGEPSDKVKIHISESDLYSHAIPYVNPETIFFGTHLKFEKGSRSYRIKYVKAGDIITL
jgi:positive regulator of sigma E activity